MDISSGFCFFRIILVMPLTHLPLSFFSPQHQIAPLVFLHIILSLIRLTVHYEETPG